MTDIRELGKQIDWRSAVRSVAPGLATLLGGPLAGGVVTILAESLLGKSTGTQAGDEAALEQKLAAGLTPEDRAKILAAETELKREMIKAGLREKEIALEADKAYIGDTAHARETHAKDRGVMRLGMGINLLSYALVGLVLWGCYTLLGGQKVDVDPALAAAVGSIVGAAVQWVMANAAQANGFFFGSSPGSRQMAVDLSKAVGDAIQSPALTRPK